MAFNLKEPDDVFYLSYGKCLGAWAQLENTLAFQFVRLSGMSQDVGLSVFYSARSFQSRADMLAACIGHAKTVPAGRKFLAKCLTLARDYATLRNTLAHDQHGLTMGDGSGAMERSIFPLLPGRVIRRGQIDAATLNFHHLAFAVELSQGQKRLLRDPELSLRLSNLLSPDALRPAPDPDAITQASEQLRLAPEL